MSRNAALSERHRLAVTQAVATKSIYAARAAGSEIWDADGRRYIDFAAGIAVTNTGHCHPKVMAAVAEQAKLFTHTCFHVTPFEGYVRLAERLNQLAPVRGKAKTLLVTTGAEALENAVKIARVATQRTAIIAFSGGFHGRTMMTMALTGKITPYKKGFGPFPADVFHAPFPYEYMGVTGTEALSGLKALFATDVDPDRVAAIVIEPIQGEGGFVPAPLSFLQNLRSLCDEHGILLIVDEVQCGMARTGKMFGCQHAGIEADLVTIAKGLAGGFPLAAVVGRADLMDAPSPGALGGTYAGNPIAVAAANAVLDLIEEEKLCARAESIGATLFERLRRISSRSHMEAIGDIRGRGAMVAFELVKDRLTKEPDAALCARIVAAAQERGAILLSAGTRANVVRLLPALTMPADILEEGLDILEKSIEASMSVATRSAA
ncbi:MAG: 4-aminobutyrate transaminase [Gammaproteobacteria bacterium]|nr:4-aminobutyrate transaminase [Gammaproteobacteria bacterium]